MKRRLFAIVWISILCLSCIDDDPEFCYECTTVENRIQVGNTEREETKNTYCGKTSEEADAIEKKGTHTERIGELTIDTRTTCMKQ